MTPRYFDRVRPLHGGRMSQEQVNGHLAILHEAFRRGVSQQQTAYVLATTHHETGGTMMPVRETFASTDQQAIDRLERAWRSGKLAWVKTPYWRDGWFGRGLVQITHLDNYRRLSPYAGVNLVVDPTAALRMDIALKIMFEGMLRGLFTGKSLDDVSEPATSAPNFLNDRIVVNGKDRATLIAGYADTFYDALAGVSHAPATAPRPEPKPEPKPEPPSTLASIVAWLAALFRR